jgi:hypothetical protein
VYLCLRAYKSDTDIDDAKATIDIITASFIKLKNSEIPGRAGAGNPEGILPTTAKLKFTSSLAKCVISVPKIIFFFI